MATTTLGVKLDDPTRERLKAAAHSIDRTPHWLIKQAIFNYLEKLESGATLLELNGATGKDSEDRGELAEDAACNAFWILPKAFSRNRCCVRRSPQRTVARSRKWCPCCWNRRA